MMKLEIEPAKLAELAKEPRIIIINDRAHHVRITELPDSFLDEDGDLHVLLFKNEGYRCYSLQGKTEKDYPQLAEQFRAKNAAGISFDLNRVWNLLSVALKGADPAEIGLQGGYIMDHRTLADLQFGAEG